MKKRLVALFSAALALAPFAPLQGQTRNAPVPPRDERGNPHQPVELAVEFCPAGAVAVAPGGNLPPPEQRDLLGCFAIRVPFDTLMRGEGRVGVIATFNVVKRRLSPTTDEVVVYGERGKEEARSRISHKDGRVIKERFTLAGRGEQVLSYPEGVGIEKTRIYFWVQGRYGAQLFSTVRGATLQSCRRRGQQIGLRLLEERGSALRNKAAERGIPLEQYRVLQWYCLQPDTEIPPLEGPRI